MRHEIPTHLGVRDKLVLGLSARQVMVVLAGLAAAHATWTRLGDLPWLPLPARLAAACAVVALFASVAVIRPQGRGLDAWAFALARYAALPKFSVWRPACRSTARGLGENDR
jgi:hypothetical protein